MNEELQDLLCRCSPSSNTNERQRNSYKCLVIKCPAYESDKDDRETLDDDSWDIISALKQKLCQLSKLQNQSEGQSVTARESPRYSCSCTKRQIFENRSLVERASDSIDYSPESEFLRKIKQQCQNLQNRLPNIFSTLNDCSPENNINECQKCFLLRSKTQLNNGRSWKCCRQQPDLSYIDKKLRMKCSSIFQRPSSENESYSRERLKVKKKSNHISRSKKRDRSRRFRKRKSKVSSTSLVETEFEPSLKKPSENSCERCWRFASPARSPVNKPDQRFDPNFRRGHSTTTIPKGEGDGYNFVAESGGSDIESARNTRQNLDKVPRAKSACGTRSRSPVNSSESHAAPHKFVKQKMEGAWQTGAKECPKHEFDKFLPSYAFLNEDEQFPPTSQKKCPLHMQTQSPSRTQHICTNDMDFLQQQEASHKPRSRTKCPGPPEQTNFRRRSPQKVSLQLETPQQIPPEIICPSSRSLQRKCPEQTAPRLGHKCKQPYQEPLFCPKSCPQSPQDCGQGSNRMSPRGNENLDEAAYKDICTNKRKDNCSPCPNPCGRGKSSKKTPPCGSLLKMSKPSDRYKMETITEVSSKNIGEDEYGTKGDKSEGTTYRKNMKGTPGASGTSGTSGTSGLDPRTGRQPIHAKDGFTSKNYSANRSTEKSEHSKRGTKRDKSNMKKSPDKGKSGVKVRGGRGGGANGKKVHVDSEDLCGDRNPDEFDKAHPIRPCRCSSSLPDSTEPFNLSGGNIFCCHCDWNKETSNECDFLSQTNAPRKRGCQCQASRQNAPSPERLPQIPKDGATECPYRAITNKLIEVLPPHCIVRRGNNCPQGPRENHGELCPREQLEHTPRKYFMYYMTQERDKPDNNLEVLVEELAQGCPKNEADSKTKDIIEKMKKITEPPPDSMALRFQKGVNEVCNVPQTSRMLYF